MSYCATKEEGRETLKMIKHLEKGQFGYLSAKKKRNLIIMIIAFAFVIACFIIGLVIFKNKNNILTVASVVLVLPAAKFAVAYFILLPHASAQLYYMIWCYPTKSAPLAHRWLLLQTRLLLH